MQLRTEFSPLNKGASSMHDYLNCAKIIIDNLAAIGLGPDYKGFRTALNLSGVNHTLKTLHGPLLTQEASLLLDDTASSDFTAASPMANLAHHLSRSNLQHRSHLPSRPDPQPRSVPMPCFDNPHPSPSFSPNQRSNRGGCGNRATHCQVCNRHGHSVITCYNRFNQHFKPRHQRPLDYSPSPQVHTLYAPPPPSQAGLLPTPSCEGSLFENPSS